MLRPCGKSVGPGCSGSHLALSASVSPPRDGVGPTHRLPRGGPCHLQVWGSPWRRFTWGLEGNWERGHSGGLAAAAHTGTSGPVSWALALPGDSCGGCARAFRLPWVEGSQRRAASSRRSCPPQPPGRAASLNSKGRGVLPGPAMLGPGQQCPRRGGSGGCSVV